MGEEFENRVVAWFSCGAASAVASKLAVDTYGEKCVVVYCDTLSAEHPDNARFLRDVEQWIGRHIQIIRSAKYASVDDVFERARFMSGPHGARCTTEMKKIPREEFQHETDSHVFGFTYEEQRRAAEFDERNPALHTLWLLINAGITKQGCLDILSSAGIALPAMYTLGFEHNNCIGCVKSTSAGYWNRVRRLFPETFERRARVSREIGARLVRVDGRRVFLDELPPDSSAPDDDIECGPVCQLPLSI